MSSYAKVGEFWLKKLYTKQTKTKKKVLYADPLKNIKFLVEIISRKQRILARQDTATNIQNNNNNINNNNKALKRGWTDEKIITKTE